MLNKDLQQREENENMLASLHYDSEPSNRHRIWHYPCPQASLQMGCITVHAHFGSWVQCFTQESVDLMGRIIYGPHVGVGDIAGVGPGAPGLLNACNSTLFASATHNFS